MRERNTIDAIIKRAKITLEMHANQFIGKNPYVFTPKEERAEAMKNTSTSNKFRVKKRLAKKARKQMYANRK